MTGQSQRLMPRAWVEIDLGALVRNGAAFARAAGTPILPMVKADAYGLGALRIARALGSLEIWGFGVATVEEGDELRRGGIEKPILVFNPLLPSQFDAVRRARLTPVLGDPSVIAEWTRSGGAWHLAIDTGMNRAGVPWHAIASVRDLVAASPPEGICTHFHSAQLPNGSREEQEKRFRESVAALGVKPGVLHADNSAAIEHRAPSPYSFARPGIFLYGVGSGHDAVVEPEPVVHVRARIVEIRVVREGDTVSYDATWRAPRAGRIATLSIGYADGYRRAFGNAASALLNGEKVAIVGYVTMDMTMVDVTDRRCAVGDVVTLLGRDGSAIITVGEAAARASVSPYEVLTGLRQRLPRLYVGNDS